VLGLGLLVGTLLVGNAFCGWICPFGAIQDALSWVRRRLHLPTVTVPARLDALLRWGRFAVLGVVVFMSYTTARLWFAGYDRYVTLFGLHWLFGAESADFWIALVVLALVVAGSLVIDRFWCRYLCPLGAALSVASVFSLVRIRRSGPTCTDCTLCDKPCPVGIQPSKAAPLVAADCIGCMDCVATCPVRGALTVGARVPLPLPGRPKEPEPDRAEGRQTGRQTGHEGKRK